ncbi:B-cell receptor CD22-like [Myripristis murdjan]|uniref:B-cell receptor CD22-like n=1 Tax=Myripristis murdjan TaxID=586833 RepID=UPI0011763907|nr:B-cell receptor CD22-like [Myripristis murdjan]
MIHKMKASDFRWLVFLAITIDFSCSAKLFETLDTHLRAKEGSCIEIRCIGYATQIRANEGNAVWSWMKDAKYHKANRSFTGTVIYSTTPKYPVSLEFEGRVEYLGSLSFGRQSQNICGIKINNLKKTDSGNYSFKYEGTHTWMTKPMVNLTVEENPCKITFEKPPTVKESDPVTLQCSTSSSCHSSPEIKELQSHYQQDYDENLKVSRVSFFTNWEDDGRMFTCQLQDEKDNCPAQSIHLTVEHSPRSTEARKSPEDVKEGDVVTLTCSTRGRPDPTFSWFKDGTEATVIGAEWKINSITASESGTYHCVATNNYGSQQSDAIHIEVKYPPSGVTVETNKRSEITEEDDIVLTCAVSRSNPEPHSFRWYQNNNRVGEGKTYEIKQIQPERSGSYTCEATNSVGAARSQPYQINVLYAPRNAVVSRNDVGGDSVKIRKSVSLTCNTEAFPEPHTYSWYSNSHHKLSHSQKDLRIDRVDREDHGCYICSATNVIGSGTNSSALCIKVLFPPTKPILSMPAEATEGQNITISCTTESFPLAQLTLSQINSNSHFSSTNSLPISDNVRTLNASFEVTPDHAGRYLCNAINSEGSDSTDKELVVKYPPSGVTVKTNRHSEITEGDDIVLTCAVSRSNPEPHSFRWYQNNNMVGEGKTYEIKQIQPERSGSYTCEAANSVGAARSQPYQINVGPPSEDNTSQLYSSDAFVGDSAENTSSSTSVSQREELMKSSTLSTSAHDGRSSQSKAVEKSVEDRILDIIQESVANQLHLDFGATHSSARARLLTCRPAIYSK